MAEFVDTRRKDRLDYIHSMLGELRKMADADQHQMLAYFIEMSYTEAGDRLRSSAHEARSDAAPVSLSDADQALSNSAASGAK